MYAPGVLWTAAHHQIPLLSRDAQQPRLSSGSDARAAHGQPPPARHDDRARSARRSTDPNIDFAKLAQSMGVHAEGPITDPKDLGRRHRARARGREARRARAGGRGHAATMNPMVDGSLMNQKDLNHRDLNLQGHEEHKGRRQHGRTGHSVFVCFVFFVVRFLPSRHRWSRRQRLPRGTPRTDGSCSRPTGVISAMATRHKVRRRPARGSGPGRLRSSSSRNTSASQPARCRRIRARSSPTPRWPTSTRFFNRCHPRRPWTRSQRYAEPLEPFAPLEPLEP